MEEEEEGPEGEIAAVVVVSFSSPFLVAVSFSNFVSVCSFIEGDDGEADRGGSGNLSTTLIPLSGTVFVLTKSKSNSDLESASTPKPTPTLLSWKIL
jgi:hypothetical protein